ncbi:type III ribulose-bisphosphate carboxylase [archaeon]|jgi:ribulose-bisphosphate carboxylase large chain|nr:type III ribulose-bisphosphate carboxylase [archaeon]
MIYGNCEFVDKKYKPKSTDLVVMYRVEPIKGISLERICELLAGESSIGTWTKISTMNPTIAKKLKPHAFYINKKKNLVKIAYPEKLFEKNNMSGILSSIAGNIYGMKEAKKLRLEDITFPKNIVKAFPGPQFGIKGIRKLIKIKKRPLIGTIVKPKVGLTAKQHAKVAYESWVGGLDIVKDDENLTSMEFNNFYKRITLTLKARDKAEKETGEKKIYLPNITAEYEEMKKRAEHVKKKGGEVVMVDILTVGWSSLAAIRNVTKKLKLAIHGHRAMHGALTRDPKHGISMLVLAKISRLLGTDQLHIGTAGIGKMHGSASEELSIEYEIEQQKIKANPKLNRLEQDWYGMKPILAVASGGVSPLQISKIVKTMGNDIIIQAGGGVHGHPNGTRAGATAMLQAIESTMKKIPLKQYAKTHKELEQAFSKWK